MIDLTIDMQAAPPAGGRGFHGNGNCDATRMANKRADHPERIETTPRRATGMESEIAPWHGEETRMVPQRGGNGGAYDNPEYGPNHPWTPEEEEGMNSITQDSFDEQLSADEAARNSWRALLARNVGRNVLVRFLMGTQNMVTVEGELYEVGTDYIVIYQPLWDSHITADLYSVKFVEFREPPGQALG